jgi:hypothetical protein
MIEAKQLIELGLAFDMLGLGSRPEVVIRHWQDWMKLASAEASMLFGVVPNAAGIVTLCGIMFRYGGEYPSPYDNSDVR